MTENKKSEREFSERAYLCGQDLGIFLEKLDLQQGVITVHDTTTRIITLESMLTLPSASPDIQEQIREGIAYLKEQLESSHKITISFSNFPDATSIKTIRQQMESHISRYGGVLDIAETREMATILEDNDGEFLWLIEQEENALSTLQDTNASLYEQLTHSNWTDKIRNPLFIYSFS